MGQREDDTLSGGSELITVCSGLIHKSIVANELALKREPVQGGSLTVSVALRLLTLYLKKEKGGGGMKMFLSGCSSPGNKDRNEQNQVGESDESSSSPLLSAPHITRWEEERK